jgi:hypothetical protein
MRKYGGARFLAPQTIDFIGIFRAHFHNSGGAPLLLEKMIRP